MALILKILTPSGATANYHKVANLFHNTVENKFSAVLYTYINKQLKDKGFQPIWTRGIQIFYTVEGEHDITNIVIGENHIKSQGKIEIIDFTRANLYHIIKQLPGTDKAKDHLVEQVVNEPEPEPADQNMPI